jgi:hypothetical protein
MAGISEVLEQSAAKQFAIDKLGYFILEVLPNRKLVPDSPNSSIPTTDFISLDILNQTSYSGGMGQRHIYYEIDELGNETYVYKDKVVVELYAYIGKANNDLDKLRTMLNNKYLKFKHFGSTNGLVGVTEIGNVIDNKVTVYESQETRSGARLRLALTYIYKVVDNYGEYVDEVKYVTKSNVADQSIIQNNHTILGLSEETLASINALHFHINYELPGGGDSTWTMV